jgi:hypothetical protein
MPPHTRLLQVHDEILAGQLNVFENPVQEAWADDFACVYRDLGAPTISMLKKVVAAPDPDDCKSSLPQCRYDLTTAKSGQLAHG